MFNKISGITYKDELRRIKINKRKDIKMAKKTQKTENNATPQGVNSSGLLSSRKWEQ